MHLCQASQQTVALREDCFFQVGTPGEKVNFFVCGWILKNKTPQQRGVNFMLSQRRQLAVALRKRCLWAGRSLSGEKGWVISS